MRQKNNQLDLKKNAVIDEFIDHLWLEDGLSKNTLISYRFDITLFSNWLSESMNLELIHVSQSEIQQY